MFVSNLTARDEANSITAKVDGGAGPGVIRFYSGTPPADADTALSGNTLLAELTLSDPSFATATDNAPGALITLDVTPIPEDTSANATGTASFARIFESGGVCIVQLTAGTSGTEIILNSAAIQAGASVQITAGTILVPEN